METLPVEERLDLDATAQEIARFTTLMVSQKIEHTASSTGMDDLAKEYLYDRTFRYLVGED